MVEMDKNDRRKRWVRAIKSNFDESDYARIRLIMDDERKLSFAEFEDENNDAQPTLTKIEIASSILQEILKDSAMPVTEINQFMAEEGIGPKTAQRAKVRIGAVQEYKDGVPIWRLQTIRWTSGQRFFVNGFTTDIPDIDLTATIWYNHIIKNFVHIKQRRRSC